MTYDFLVYEAVCHSHTYSCRSQPAMSVARCSIDPPTLIRCMLQALSSSVSKGISRFGRPQPRVHLIASLLGFDNPDKVVQIVSVRVRASSRPRNFVSVVQGIDRLQRVHQRLINLTILVGVRSVLLGCTLEGDWVVQRA